MLISAVTDAHAPLTGTQDGGAVPVLQTQATRFAFSGQDVTQISFDPITLHAGDRLLVCGPSGSGKSTLLSLLAGVRLAQAGQISLLGKNWAELSTAQRDLWRADHIGFIFQQFNLLDWLSALDNVLLPTRFSALRATRALVQAASLQAAAAYLLEMLDVPRNLWHQNAGQLSVGQQQRVAAARALIGSPELILADEPTSALDEDLRDRFMTALNTCCAQARSSLILVSHDRALARYFEHHLQLPRLAVAQAA